MRIAAPLLALLVLLTGTVPAVALAAPAGPQDGTQTTDRPALAGPTHARIETPTVTEIYLAPDADGSARWTVSVRYNLSTDADRAAFERYGRTFEAGDADVGPGAAFFRRLAAEASRVTGREMSIQNLERNATVHNDSGVLRLSFTWTNFVVDTDDGFRIHDAVLMPGNRTWLASIDADQRLVVETPPGYRVTDTRFGLENGSVVVEGPHTFREPLTITYQQTATEPESGPPWTLVAGVVLAAAVLGAALVYVRRTRGTAPSPTAESNEPPDRVPTSGPEPPSDAEEAGDESAAGEPPEPADGDDGEAVDPSLLSDEERVERLLDRNGGRMKQARIVEETGWSDAKVSQLLSTMADEGRIEKLRLGRENLISLPDEEP